MAGICHFDEFVRHIGGKDFDKWKKTAAGWTLYPDAPSCVTKVEALAKAKGKGLLYDTSKLHSKLIGKVSQTKSLTAVTNTAQESRELAVGLGYTVVDGAVTDGMEFLRIIQNYRLQDQWRYLKPAVEGSDAARPFLPYLKTETKNIRSVDGASTLDTFLRYDIDATLAAAGSNVNDAQKDTFKAYVRGYGATKDASAGGSSAKSHKDVINAITSTYKLIKADIPISGCEPPPA